MDVIVLLQQTLVRLDGLEELRGRPGRGGILCRHCGIVCDIELQVPVRREACLADCIYIYAVWSLLEAEN